MTKIKISGETNNEVNSYKVSLFELKGSYLLNTNRATGNEITINDIDNSEIAHVIFDDNIEWIGNISDIHEINARSTKTRDVSEEIMFPSVIYSDSQTRSDLGSAVVKIFNRYSGKIAAFTGKNLAEFVDKKLMSKPGLYGVSDTLNLIELGSFSMNKEKILLLLHGTISDTVGSFGGLNNNEWSSIYKLYDKVIALEHHTLSQSPIQNAIAVLRVLPANAVIDIMSHSRGGLVADVLARCDRRNARSPYDEVEIDLLTKYENYAALCNEVNALAKVKGIEVNNVVRVACPAGGTTLLSHRLDHFLNGLLNTIGFAFGSKANIYYECAKTFLMGVIAQKENPESIPGLWSMVPNSDYQKINNSQQFLLPCKTYVISGDSEVGGGIANSLKVIFTNLFYRDANDFVVNTSSMVLGLRRNSGVYNYLSQDSNTNHFNYFKHEKTTVAIRAALSGATNFDINGAAQSFDLITNVSGNRDLAADILGFKKYNVNNISGNKPIVVILPGIMGSTLENEKDIWFDVSAINSGSMVTKLSIDAENVIASGVLSKYYKKIAEYMMKDFDVCIIPFDWRKSIEETALMLKGKLEEFQNQNQPIKIVAHSMGGLLLKGLMMDHADFWKKINQENDFKCVLLGTPWMGSHLIMEVLTGHSRKINQISFLDFHHSKKEILEVVGRFPGLWQLLAIDENSFDELNFWNNINKLVPEMATIPSDSIKVYDLWKKKSLKHVFEKEDFANVYYLAGHDDTVCGFQIKKSFFGERIQYETTNLGDGSVTYELGIPREMDTNKIFYCKVNHTNLAADANNFDGIKDLITKGQTFRFDQKAPVNRSNEIKSLRTTMQVMTNNEEDILNNIFDVSLPIDDYNNLQQIPIQVSVLNADLLHAKYPVMVGHFMNDGIYSGEKKLNYYLKNILGERHRLGFYPGRIGESEVTYHKENKPKGALVVGMGQLDEITPHQLSVSVEKALIKYAFFFRDNYVDVEIKRKGCGISSLIIGSSYGGMSIEDCIKSILIALDRANKKILSLDNGLMPIKEIEFIDYYEDLAQFAYRVIKQIDNNQTKFKLELKGLKSGPGRKRRLRLTDNASWWHTFTTVSLFDHCKEGYEKKLPDGLTYNSAGNKARVEQNNISSDLRMVEFLSKSFSHNARWDKELAKTMFELLVPNDFKPIIRNQSNILWQMDDYAAQFPWEMFHDYNYGDEPTFINTGLIRQLHTGIYRENPTIVEQNTALVIGDPLYEGKYPQLPGAVAEASAVIGLLSPRFNTNQCINTDAATIVKEMYSKDYKILHIAAHGVHDAERSGVVIGPDVFLTPGTINQLSAIPEFIFVNCCFSGDMTNYGDSFFKERNRLASNVGTQLIRMGVKAVIVCGWAVEDNAAKVFATEFYARMLDGYEFGPAVVMARRKCYEANKNSNTWGAYQCYGDHYYKLVQDVPNNKSTDDYEQEIEAVIDLDNLMSLVQGQKINIEETKNDLISLSEKINRSNVNSANVQERISKIYAELGIYDKAIEILYGLLYEEKADFNVSSLEQYCSLRGKQLVYDFRKSGSFPKDKLDKILKDLDFIGIIGNTSERYALKGSAYKRAIILDRANQGKHALAMKDNFLQAYNILKEKSPAISFYPLSNYLIATYLNNTPFPEISSELGIKQKNFANYMKALEKTLDTDTSTYDSYYEKNALAKFYLLQLLYANPSDIKPLEKKITESLISSVKEYANMKQIKGEIEHLEFLKDIINDQSKINFLDRIIAELKKEINYDY